MRDLPSDSGAYANWPLVVPMPGLYRDGVSPTPRGDREGDRPTAAGWRAAAVVGAGLCLGGNGGVVWAEQYVTSGLAALIVSTLPLWMALLGRVFFGVAISPRAIVGLVLGLGGVMLLVGPIETGGAHVMGALARSRCRRSRRWSI
ncbi:MAG TPA: EamA family transporter [Candidatus Limnocylindria bacterium]|nr:EamA family transporter [Candidatus Limnocylindria bacterium]